MYLRASKYFKNLNVSKFWIWEVKPDGLFIRAGDAGAYNLTWEIVENRWSLRTSDTSYEWDILTEEEAFLEMI